jgi:putative transposase
LASIRTIYRVLHRHQEVRERRSLTMRPNYQRPELLATRPNQL